jgi:RHS repeat-associated protein
MKRTCYFLICLIAGLLFSAITVNYAQAQCGNNASHDPDHNEKCPDPPTGDPFNPYTGNEHREVIDLEIWGSTGDIPMVWRRYYNSRDFTGWTYSFNYLMADAGTNAFGQPQLSIKLPEGGRITLARSDVNPLLWLGVPGVQERMFQDGNNFFLQMADGHRYRFRKFNNPEGSFYQLQDMRDQHQNIYTLTYDGAGMLTRITEPAGRYFEISYIFLGGQTLLNRVITNDGRAVQYNYNVYNDGVTSWPLLTNVQYGDGTAATYEYHPPHYSGLGFIYLAHAIDPRYSGPQGNMRFTYDTTIARGYIKEEINGKTGEVMVTLTGDENNRWACYANGRVQHLVMPGVLLGKTTEYTDGLGRAKQYEYDANGFLSKQTDPLGRITSYIRTVFGNALQITHPDGSVEKWTRDNLDLELTYTDELGRITTYTRDALHRVTMITYPNGSTETFTYNGFGQVLTHKLRNGGTESNTYNAVGLKTSFTDALGNVTSYTYDAAGRMASQTDARSNLTRYEYNERGLLVKMINADNSFQLHAYDDFGNRTLTVNELGNSWKRLFDEFKRMTSSTDPLNRTTAYSYDLPGGVCGCAHDVENPTRIVLPSGKITVMEYDVEWQKVKETIGAGTMDQATAMFEYDVLGRLTSITDPRLKIWTYTYDLRDRVHKTTDPSGVITEKLYDNAGNLIKTIRADNGITLQQYDNMNYLVQTTDAKGQIIQQAYDAAGNMINVTDARGQHYQFQYDLMNRKTRMIYPDGSFERYTYDAAGNNSAYINRAGDIRTYTYDNRNRETNSVWSDGTPAVTTGYDATSKVTSITSSVSTLSYSYNAADELTGETQNIHGAGGAKQINYTYNSDGLRQALVYPGASMTVSYDYTARNQTAAIYVNGAAIVSYGYDAAGNRVAQFRDNGVGTSYVYDNNNRVLSLTHQKSGVVLSHHEYGYDNMSRRTFERRNWNKGDVYAYDAVDQVTDVQYEVNNPNSIPSGAIRTVSYNYDASGNRMQINDNSAITTYSSNSLNQYTQVGSNPATYNANGDLTNINGWTYMYDAQGRLTNASNGTITVSMTYDGRNRCATRTVNGTTSFFYYDGWNLVEENETGGAQLKQYIHGTSIDELVARKDAGGSIYYLQDVLGNVTHLTNTAGNMAEQYSYDVFGLPVVKNVSGTVISTSAYGNRFMFTGREFVQEIALYDYRNRMYSPLLGRFLQIDPLRFDGKDYNLYRYVHNNPVNYIDPTGLSWWGTICRGLCTAAAVGAFAKCTLLTSGWGIWLCRIAVGIAMQYCISKCPC